MSDKIDKLPAFMDRVHRKMIRGQAEFEDRSFSYDPIRLLNEIQDELVDVCGWSYTLWRRLEDMKDEIGRVRLQALREVVKAKKE